ncbi:hypothetical protein Acid345_3092 [Candidatus Koribacter versatilis Ellin345]|uniref:Uncharacterized protein n=1 Tax=Koribacter versatilis (strain Ellin345) TaxID=204669 RepID=Q1IM07_KORVE|nr:hypothetical protein [Candidatus Koribacter versatilis]ABF42093.1 hypothetical protein Acid345_3092 [Candidatus Koribacter versatilis Ellin345]
MRVSAWWISWILVSAMGAASGQALPADVAQKQAAAQEEACNASPPSTEYDNGEVPGTKDYVRMNKEVALGGTLTVPVQGLDTWSKCAANDPHKLRLFLAGHMLPDLEPTLVAPAQNYINFPLKIQTAQDDQRQRWVALLSEARRSGGKIAVGVGVQQDEPFVSDAFVTLRIYPKLLTISVLALIVALLVLLVVIAIRSDVLRDTSSDIPKLPLRLPYSLGRVQMAFWFYLTVASYLYIWLMTTDKNSLTTSVLTLIGISAGTGLSAVIVDHQKSDDAKTTRAVLMTEIGALQQRIKDLAAAAPAAGTDAAKELSIKQDLLAVAQNKLLYAPPVSSAPSSMGFFRDIVRDGCGVSFHRFQIAVWTLVLGIIFVRAVYGDLAMPDFSGTLLGLMGISSGTYLGFKFPETPK